MNKIGVFYGSTTGVTAKVAGSIARELGVDDVDVHDMAKSKPSDVAPYDLLVLGTSTWGAGDMQEDAHDFADGLQGEYLAGKKVALFGCGDETMSTTFCDGVAELYDYVSRTGANIIGRCDAPDFDFSKSRAVDADGKALGLLVDDMNHADATSARIKRWCEQLKKDM